MTGPATLFTANAIAYFAFRAFLKTEHDTLSSKFSARAIEKMDELRNVLWAQLTEKSATAESALSQAKAGDEQAISIVANFLDVEMMIDESFAAELQQLAQTINAGKIR